MAGGLLIDVAPLRASKDFRNLWISQLMTVAGQQLVLVAVPYEVYLLTRSSLAVGAVGLVQAIPIVLAGLFGGAYADAHERRRLMLITKSLLAAGSTVLAVAVALGRPTVVLLLAVVAITAAAGTVHNAGRSAVTAQVVERALLARAISLQTALIQLGSVAGPAIGGVVIAVAGPRAAFALDALLFVPSAWFLLRLPPQPPRDGHAVVTGLRAPLEGLRYVAGNRLVASLFAADLVAMVFGMPTAVFPALALSVTGGGAAALGLMYAAPGAGALVASLLSGPLTRLRNGGAAVLVSIAVWGAAIALAGAGARVLPVMLPLLALAGAADLVSTIFRQTILQLAIPDSIRGRMSAFHVMNATLGPRLGDAEAGLVASVSTPVFSMISGGVACVVGIIVVAALVPELRRRTVRPIA